MRVTVEYSAQIRRLTGCENETVEVDDGATAQDLIQRLGATRGDSLARYLLDEERRLRSTVLAFVNDEQVEWDESRALATGDTLVLMSAIAGGAL